MKNIYNVVLVFMICLCTISCDLDGYGPSVQTGGVEIFYKPDKLKEQAKQLSVMLDTLGYGSDSKVSFQLIKDSIININMVTKDQYHTDKSLDYSLNAVGLLASMEMFKGETVQMHLCDEQFKRKRSLDRIEK